MSSIPDRGHPELKSVKDKHSWCWKTGDDGKPHNTCGVLRTGLTPWLINKQNGIYMYPIDVSRVLEEINKLGTVNLKINLKTT